MPRIIEVPDNFVEAAWALMTDLPGGSAAAGAAFESYNVPRPDQIEAAPEGTYKWMPPSRVSFVWSVVLGVAMMALYILVQARR